MKQARARGTLFVSLRRCKASRRFMIFAAIALYFRVPPPRRRPVIDAVYRKVISTLSGAIYLPIELVDADVGRGHRYFDAAIYELG